VYCFVTSNHRDFPAPNGDRRQLHPDLADIFSSPQSRYLYLVRGSPQTVETPVVVIMAGTGCP